MNDRISNRRCFLRSAGAAALTIPYAITRRQRAWAADAVNGRPNVAAIGVGKRGTIINNHAAKFGSMLASCDVDRHHAEAFAAHHGNGCQVYQNYEDVLQRDDIDAVVIGTPDHWHAKMLIDSVRAGKDVYCEKPLTLTVDEGKQIQKALAQSDRVVQVGTHRRSSWQYLAAVALARSGRLGKQLKITCANDPAPRGGPFQNADPPKHLDWDRWLGQAPLVPYCPERCHGSFRWWLEYSGGKVTDWGAHRIDIAQWAIGCEDTGPVEIEGVGEFPSIPNGYNVAAVFDCTLRFANGHEILMQSTGRPGVMIEGEDGRIFINDENFSGKRVEELQQEGNQADRTWLHEQVVALYGGEEPHAAGDRRGVELCHMQNFFNRMQDRKMPIADVAGRSRSANSCHIVNIAMQLGRKLKWDTESELFVGDSEANAMLKREQREPYAVHV